MKTHTVLTPANIEIEYRLAGAGSRLAAFVIDFTVQIIICYLLLTGTLLITYGNPFGNLANVESFALAFIIISWFIVYFCYFIVCEMCFNGQSVGKKIFNLRVMRDNGQPVGLSQSLVRNLFRAVLDVLYIGLFFMLFSDKCKRIGDMVAGTVVVAEHYDTTFTPLMPYNLPKASNAGIEHLRHLVLSKEERKLLCMYLERKVYLPEFAKQRLRYKWAMYFCKKWGIDITLIDDALLSGLLQINESEYSEPT